MISKKRSLMKGSQVGMQQYFSTILLVHGYQTVTTLIITTRMKAVMGTTIL